MNPETLFVRDSRGQSVPDFAIGASIFLLVVGGALVYLPTIFEPLSNTVTANAILADRTATYLVRDLLTTGGGGPTLNAVCTAAFFSGDTSLDDSCSFTADAETRELLGIADDTDINIVITDAENVKPEPAITDEVNGVEYEYSRRTNTGTQETDTAVATRTVRIDGQLYKLIVEVW